MALAATLVAGVSTMQAQSYDLTDLGVLPGKEAEATTPSAINDLGQVAGNSGESAFRFAPTSKEPMEDLSRNLPNSVSRAFGINASGAVVGDSTFGGAPGTRSGSIRRAALFTEGKATDLGVLKRAGNYSRANGINVSGQVVGFGGPALDSTSSKAFIWSSSTGMVDLGTLGGPYAQAWGINDSGYVTGNSHTANNFPHAFLWESKTGMVDLGTLAGHYSYGTFVNAKNHVVGYSSINKEDDRVHAFLFDGKTMHDLGSLSAGARDSDRSFALGVNDNDEVVGYTFLPASGPAVGDGPTYAPRQVAFVYRNGAMVDMNNLIGGAATNYHLYSATAINNKGDITALAFDKKANVFRAVLLRPAAVNNGVTITNATYWAENQALVVEATSSENSGNGIVILDVYLPTGEKLGTLDSNGSGTYAAKLYSASKPGEILVVSSLGGSARATVKDSSDRLAAKR